MVALSRMLQSKPLLNASAVETVNTYFVRDCSLDSVHFSASIDAAGL